MTTAKISNHNIRGEGNLIAASTFNHKREKKKPKFPANQTGVCFFLQSHDRYWYGWRGVCQSVYDSWAPAPLIINVGIEAGITPMCLAFKTKPTLCFHHVLHLLRISAFSKLHERLMFFKFAGNDNYQ